MKKRTSRKPRPGRSGKVGTLFHGNFGMAPRTNGGPNGGAA
jgi:hypothetical protein